VALAKALNLPAAAIAMTTVLLGGGFTQVCACDLAVAADEAISALGVNWGILPGGIGPGMSRRP